MGFTWLAVHDPCSQKDLPAALRPPVCCSFDSFKRWSSVSWVRENFLANLGVAGFSPKK